MDWKKSTLAAAAIALSLPLAADNLLQGDTGAESGISYLINNGISLEPFPAYHDLTTAWEGRGSMRLEWQDKLLPHTGFTMPELKRGGTYTISFYAKASCDRMPLAVRLFPIGGWNLKVSYYRSLRLTRDWKRYTITFKAAAPKNFHLTGYSLNLTFDRKPANPGEKVWLDGFQLEEGRKASAYKPAQSVAADLVLKSGKPLHLVGLKDPVTADVRCVNISERGKVDVLVMVKDWEGKTVFQKKSRLGKEFKKSFRLPTSRYGWFYAAVQARANGKVLTEIHKTYLVLRPPVKIAAGIEPFAGVCSQGGGVDDIYKANWTMGAKYMQAVVVQQNRLRGDNYWDMKSPERYDFSYVDTLVNGIRKHGMLVKFNISPFGWSMKHFPEKEVAEMKKYGVHRHAMFDLRHRDIWNDYVKTVLDRYGKKIAIFEVGAEDNGRLGVNPYYKAKYPQGIMLDAEDRSWLVAGPAFDAMCTLETDALRQARKRFPKMKVGAIRPSEGTPNSKWLFVWKQFEKIGKEFNTFPIDTYARLPYFLGPAIDPSKYRGGAEDGRFETMAHAKRMIAKYGCGQDVFLSETGMAVDYHEYGLSPYQREAAEYLARDMIVSKCAGFTSYHIFVGISYSSNVGYSFSMHRPYGVQMQAAAYSMAAQAVENVIKTRWIPYDQTTRIVLLKKNDGSGVGAIWSKGGSSMKVPAGIKVRDFMGNDHTLGKDRMLKLSGAPWYFYAKTYKQLESKLSSPDIEQTEYCRMAFRQISDKVGLLRFDNLSYQLPLFIEGEATVGGIKTPIRLDIIAGSWNSQRIRLPKGAASVTARIRKRDSKSGKWQTFTQEIPVLTQIARGTKPVSVMGQVKNADDILPYEPWIPWSGASDLGAVLYGAWNEKELKLRAVVTDDLHFPSAADQRPWQGDSIQMAIDPRNNGAFASPNKRKALAADDIEFGLKLGRNGKQDLAVSHGSKALKIKTAVTRNEKNKTTVYELTIPWSELKIKPAKDMVFGLSMVVFDDDSGNGQEYHGLIGGGITHTKHPRLYKKFILK